LQYLNAKAPRAAFDAIPEAELRQPMVSVAPTPGEVVNEELGCAKDTAARHRPRELGG